MNSFGRRLFAASLCVAAGTGFLGACGSDSKTRGASDTSTSAASGAATTTAPAATGSGSGATISIKSFTFTVSPVKAGSVVNVTSGDQAPHTVSADNGEFNVPVDPGGKASFTAPAKPGTYAFHCNVHSSMKATLTVT